MQPSEIAKLALLCCGADVLARRAVASLRLARVDARSCSVLAGLGLVVMLEPDLDSTIVLALIGFVAADRRRASGGSTSRRSPPSAAGLVTVLAFAAPYRRARMFAFLHPWHDLANTGYQIAQSLIALGSGGVNGVGLGAGRAKWMFLPNAHTDFIFAIIGEELGLVGCLLVLGLFVGFGLVGLRVARRAPDRFGMLLAAGVTAWIVGQAVDQPRRGRRHAAGVGHPVAVPLGRRFVARDHDDGRGHPRQHRPADATRAQEAARPAPAETVSR